MDKEHVTPFEREQLEMLATLIQQYERERYAFEDVSPVEALRYLIDENELSLGTLSKETGIAKSTISEILKGTRHINLHHAKVFADRFKLSVEAFA